MLTNRLGVVRPKAGSLIVVHTLIPSRNCACSSMNGAGGRVRTSKYRIPRRICASFRRIQAYPPPIQTNPEEPFWCPLWCPPASRLSQILRYHGRRASHLTCSRETEALENGEGRGELVLRKGPENEGETVQSGADYLRLEAGVAQPAVGTVPLYSRR